MKKGAFTTLATLSLITWAAIHFAGFDTAIPLLKQLFTGDAIAIREDTRKTFADLLPIIAAIIPLDMIITMITTIVVSLLLGSPSASAEKRLSVHKMGSVAYMPKEPSETYKMFAWMNRQIHLIRVRLSGLLVGNSITTDLSAVVTKAADAQTTAFMGLMLVIIGEEVIARWLLVGALPRVLPSLNNTVALYVLMIVGNTIWALLHIPNYKDGNPLRTLTQFVPALMYNAVFLRFGLLGSLLLHFTFDCIIWAGEVRQRFNIVDILMIVWSGFLAWLMWSLMDKPLTDILVWLHNPVTLALPGWGFWDYMKMDLFIAASASLLLDLLLFDKPDIGTTSSSSNSGMKVDLDLSSSGPIGKLMLIVVGTVLAAGAIVVALAINLGLVYLCFWTSGLFFHEIGYKIALSSIFALFLTKANSKSAVSRSFFQGLPDYFVTFCVIEILGPQVAIWYLLIMALIDLPRSILRAADS